MRLRVTVNQGSILFPNTTLTEEARGAKAAAEAGSSCTGMLVEAELETEGAGIGGVIGEESTDLFNERKRQGEQEYKENKRKIG